MQQRLKLQQQQQALMQQALLQQQQMYHPGMLAAAMSQVNQPQIHSLFFQLTLSTLHFPFEFVHRRPIAFALRCSISL